MILELGAEQLETAAEIHSLSWQDSHRDFCSDEFISLHSPAHQAEYIKSELLAGKAFYLLVKEKPVGLVSLFGDLIENLYVLPSEQNKGYGSELLEFAIGKCSSEPTLWLLSNNERAYRLYFRRGFRKTGKTNSLTSELYELEMKLSGAADGD